VNDNVASRNNVLNQNVLEKTHVKSTETYKFQNHANTAKSSVRWRSVSKTVQSSSRTDKRTPIPYNRTKCEHVECEKNPSLKIVTLHLGYYSSDLDNRQVNDGKATDGI
jgi:hypothetical protein